MVDRVAGELEHRRLPRAEGRHRRPGAAARHEFDRRVDQAHRDGGLRCATAVLGGTRVTDLPRAVHLVAETPGPDAVRLGMAIGRPPVGDLGACRCVAVLDEVARRVGAAGPEVHREHRLHAGQARPGDELVGADRVGLDRPPGEVVPLGPPVAGADAILPVVAGDEVPARIADRRHPEPSGQIDDVADASRRRRRWDGRARRCRRRRPGPCAR